MNKKNILIVAYDINPNIGSESGIAFKWVQSLSKYYNIELYTDSRHEEALSINKIDNVNYNFISMNGFIERSLFKYKIYTLLTNFFMAKCKKNMYARESFIENIDLIHCLTPAGVHSYNNLYKTGVKTLVGPLGGGIRLPKGFIEYASVRYFLRQIGYNILFKYKGWKDYYNNAYKIIVGTEYTKVNLPIKSLKNTSVIFDTLVDTEYFLPKTKEQRDIIYIVFCGGLVKTKGCMLLLKAFNILIKERYKNLKLQILGDGKEKERILKYVEINNLKESVQLFGNVKLPIVLEVLQKSDLFCLPTIIEPGGGAILEAMACGLPIITTDYGGPAYSVTDECGIKIKPINPKDYVEKLKLALEFLVNNKEIRESMGKKARIRVVEKFSVCATEEKFIKLYKEILET